MWIKWRKAEANIKADLETLQECRNNFEQCPAPAARFASIIDGIKARSGRARIETVNRLINASVRYMSDLAQHGVLDRWTAPLATLAAGQGDCEDYAIAKYVAEVGVEAADLRFLLVRDRLGQPAASYRTPSTAWSPAMPRITRPLKKPLPRGRSAVAAAAGDL